MRKLNLKTIISSKFFQITITLILKLTKINLNELFPNLEELKEIDIDRVDLYKDKYKKNYSL